MLAIATIVPTHFCKSTMICLLCYESNDESISLKNGEAKQCSKLLHKYFRFCFEFEPNDGELCIKCWQKTLAFHEFYIQIESVHEIINKSKLLELPSTSSYDSKTNPLAETVTIKCDVDYEDNDWTGFGDDVDNFSNSSMDGNCISGLDADIFVNDLNIMPQTESVPAKKTPAKYTKKTKQKKKNKGAKKAPSSASNPSTKNRIILFTCKIRQCSEEFGTKEALVAHKTAVHKRTQCTHCPELKLVVDLNKHLRDAHNIIQNSMCEHCGQVFSGTRSLLDHIERKHEIREPLQCDICKDFFKNRDTIRSHMNYVHIQGPQACPVCGKISANRKALRKHQTIHMEEFRERFKCIICGRGFRDATKLKEHSYIHSGVTDAYVCQFCGKNFRFGSSLSAHRMKYHPMEMAHVKDRLQRKKNMEFKVSQP